LAALVTSEKALRGRQNGLANTGGRNDDGERKVVKPLSATDEKAKEKRQRRIRDEDRGARLARQRVEISYISRGGLNGRAGRVEVHGALHAAKKTAETSGGSQAQARTVRRGRQTFAKGVKRLGREIVGAVEAAKREGRKIKMGPRRQW
jgi:hypothetical protein